MESKVSEPFTTNLPIIIDSKVYKKTFFGTQINEHKNSKGITSPKTNA
jgi:hypothetical protein